MDGTGQLWMESIVDHMTKEKWGGFFEFSTLISQQGSSNTNADMIGQASTPQAFSTTFPHDVPVSVPGTYRRTESVLK